MRDRPRLTRAEAVAAVAEIALAFPGRIPDDTMRVWSTHIYDLSPRAADLRAGVSAMIRGSQHPSLAALVSAINAAADARAREAATIGQCVAIQAGRYEDDLRAITARQIAVDAVLGRIPHPADELGFARLLEARLAGAEGGTQ